MPRAKFLRFVCVLLSSFLAFGCRQRPSDGERNAAAAASSAPSVAAASRSSSASTACRGLLPADTGRAARKKRAEAGLPVKELDAVERSAESFFDARETSEVDLTGGHGCELRQEERARLEADLVTALERARDPGFPEQTADPRAAELELEAVYMHVVTCPRIAAAEATIPGAVTVNGIRNTERLWISYRDAWVALGTRLRPGTSAELWRAWLNRARAVMLGKLATGC